MRRQLIDLFYDWWDAELETMSERDPSIVYELEYPYQSKLFSKWLETYKISINDAKKMLQNEILDEGMGSILKQYLHNKKMELIKLWE
jgi:hypothetical protein